MRVLKTYLETSLRLFINEPPNTMFQRGYLRSLIETYIATVPNYDNVLVAQVEALTDMSPRWDKNVGHGLPRGNGYSPNPPDKSASIWR